MRETPALSSNLYNGQICAFFEKEHFLLGIITSQTDRAIQVYAQNHETYNLHPARLVITSLKVFSTNNQPETISSFAEAIDQAASSISAQEIWNRVNTKLQPLTIDEVIAECRLETSDTARFAVFNILRANQHLFKHKGITYYALSEEESKAALQAEFDRQIETDYHNAIEEWVSGLVNQTDTKPVLANSIQNRFEQELFLHTHAKPIQWLNHVFRKVAPDKNYKDMLILIRIGLGQIDCSTDRFLALSGLPVLFPRSIIDEASQAGIYSNEKRLDLSEVDCWSVDAEDTEDIDDAVSLQTVENGWILGIHISDVSYLVKPGSLMDKEAQRRTSSIYLPEANIHMLPELISCNKASLIRYNLRPALSLLCKINECYNIVSYTIRLTGISVKHRFSYSEFDNLMQADGSNGEQKTKIDVLQKIIEKHLSRRTENGAKIVYDPEQTASRHLIAELMVIYNSKMAELARQHSLPFFYRYLEANMPLPDTNDTVGELMFPASVIGLEPIPHQAMGLDVYAQLTSPLRRYADLINQRQITTFLLEKHAFYQTDDLEQMITHLMVARQNIRLVTHQSEQYRQMTIICNAHLHKRIDAIVVKQRRNHTILHLPDFNVRIQTDIRPYYPKGTMLSVRIEELNPDSGIAEVQVL